jgi:hypothetical protein
VSHLVFRVNFTEDGALLLLLAKLGTLPLDTEMDSKIPL